jgi:hypothetical protein
MGRWEYPFWLATAFASGIAGVLGGGIAFLCPLCVAGGVFLVAAHRRRLERWHKPTRYLNCASVIVQQDEEAFWRSLEGEGPFDEF